MNTRREIVKAGVGLAAIIAAGKAPAALMRSMLGMHGALMAAGKLSAKSYVQEGLVAMWDGIENAGWGQHDASATVWKDLVGTYNGQLTGSASFTDDGLKLSGGYATLPGSINLSTKMADGCISWESPLNVNVAVVFDFVDTGLHYVLGRYYSNFLTGYSRVTASFTQNIRNFSVTTDKIYMNATEMTNAESNFFSVRSNNILGARGDLSSVFTGMFNSFRLYSRVLTSDELAHNYAVDKARFGLPDAT